MAQAHPQQGRLQLVEAAVDARDLVPVAVALPAVSELAQPGREVRVVHQDRPAVAEAAQVLGGVEGERPEAALAGERPDGTALVESPVRLAGVLEHGDSPLAREREDRGHVRGVAVEVDGQDAPSCAG